MAADDVADTVAGIATSEPAHGTVELGGPEALPFADFVRRYLANRGDEREVVADPHAALLRHGAVGRRARRGPRARLGTVTLADWLQTPAAHR